MSATGLRAGRAAAAALAVALEPARSSLVGDTRLAALERLLAGLAAWEGRPAGLAGWLTEQGGDPDRRGDLGDLLGFAAGRLAPADSPPDEPDRAAAFAALKLALERLFGGGVVALGERSLWNGERLELLRVEGRRQLSAADGPADRLHGRAGDELANLAVSRKLLALLSDAGGLALRPSYKALYIRDLPGTHVRAHVDHRDFEFTYHLVLDHDPPAGGHGSRLVVHRAGEPRERRLPVAPGEAILLRARGTVHSWEPLAEGEERTLIAIGFARAEDGSA